MTCEFTRNDAEQLDVLDPLASLRDLFDIPDDVIYLDGNSLGALPRATPARVQQVVAQEWGQGLIRSWNSAGWMDLPHRVGDKIARLVGAGPGELIVADSTSVNAYKVLKAALEIAEADVRAAFSSPQADLAAPSQPIHRVIVSERTNFSTDLYIAQSVAREEGASLILMEPGEDPAGRLDALPADTGAVLLLTHVNYRTGAMWDMAAVTSAAHARGALVVWDLCHSAGAVPVDLTSADADFAIGCGYKYLGGGPGAPAYLWANPRHVDRLVQPLSGWMGHASPFAFETGYSPARGIARFLSGSPAIIAIAALECGVDAVLAAERFGGMTALRDKSLALTRLFAELVLARVPGFQVESPLDDAWRGSQVSLSLLAEDGVGLEDRTADEHQQLRGEETAKGAAPGDFGAYAIIQALIARGVIGDFRVGDGQLPDILRFGVAPAYLRYVDIWDAVEQLRQVMESGQWRQDVVAPARETPSGSGFAQRNLVT